LKIFSQQHWKLENVISDHAFQQHNNSEEYNTSVGIYVVHNAAFPFLDCVQNYTCKT